jgi:hypothetical protein
MRRLQPRAGGTPTGGREGGWLADAHPADRLFVLNLRRWLDGRHGQAEVWNDLAVHLGSGRAAGVLKSFEAFLRTIAVALHRRLERHAANCPCIGGDEATLAFIVRSAGRGDRDTARSIAAEIVREADLLAVIEAAARLGRMMDNIGADPVCGVEARQRLH